MCYYRSLVFSCCISDTDISQGSVTTQLRFGDIFSESIITNFRVIPALNFFLKIGQYLMKL